MSHMYRDIHEYHDACYYCAYKDNRNDKPVPKQCNGCLRGLEGFHEKKEGKQ